MNLLEVDKPEVKKTVVVYSGRFQPFHKGHYASYSKLVSKFGEANVYIGTSNDQSGPKSPFSFKEKKEIATKMFDIPSNKFVRINNPYQPVEILKKFDGKTTQYIAAVGEKDATRLHGKYFKPYKNKAGYGYDEIGYVYAVPAEQKPISGTDVRKWLGADDKEKAKKGFLKAYPKFDREIYKMITGKLNENFIKGYPSKEDVKKIQKKNDDIRSVATTDDSYVYEPVNEIENIVKSLENEVNSYITNYFNEGISETKQQSIQNFIEFATKRLKLCEIPKITLIGDKEFAESQSSLGGFNSDTKEIYVATEGRLTADICRTIAHEMVHRKQDEMGLIRNPMKDGADGSPIENQAHAIAGILMREYGRKNKQIYQEGFISNAQKEMVSNLIKAKDNFETALKYTKSMQEKNVIVKQLKDIDKIIKSLVSAKSLSEIQSVLDNINIDVSKGDTVLMGKFKNKKVQVKDIGKDSHGMPTINGKQATTFRKVNEMGSNDIHLLHIMKLYRNSIFRKRINAYLFGRANIIANPNSVARELRNMDYEDITKMEKELNIQLDIKEAEKRIPRKPGQHTGSSKHSDLYTDENPKGTIRKLRFVTADAAEKSVNKIKKSGKSHAHKIQAAVAMEQRAKAAGKAAAAAVYRQYINSIKKDEGSNVQTSNSDDVPDGSFLPKGKKRKLNADKPENWYDNGGYTQTDFPKADAIFGDEDAEERTITYTIDNLPDVEYTPTEFIKEGLLMEGGAYGHMSHPFDDMDLTFGDLQNIITGALNGDLGVVREKTDGQALAISWKNGRLIAARNKGHLENAGARAMGIGDVASKFGGRGGLTDAYNFAMNDLNAAISSLSDAQRKKIFNEGKCFMNLEVIWPQSVNVIPYGQALLIFHNTTCYDEKGSAIGADQGASSTLAGMIKQVNADVQSKYTIQGPPITEIPKNEDLSSKQGKYLSKLKKLQSEYSLGDNDTIALYHQSWWENFINKKAPVKVDKLTKESLVRRWAFGDKGYRLNTISNPKLQAWAIQNDKVNVAKQQKDNIKPFEEIFLGVGADVLDFVGSVLTVHPEKAIRAIKNKFKSVASDVRTGGDKSKIQKLRQELKRLNSLGGIDRIVASEGIVFFYNGKTYKLTGTFAPLNQILGLFY